MTQASSPFRLNNSTKRDLGSMRNALGLLSDDQKKLRPERLLSVTGLGRSEVSRIAKKPRSAFYEKELPLKLSSDFSKRIYSLVIATDFAFELFGENEEDTKNWIMAPNSILFGETPFAVCLSGEGPKLIEWLKERLDHTHGKVARR